MGTVVYVPFAASVLVALLSRVAATRLWPRAAAWAMATAALALAVSTCGALVVLASPLLAQVPLVATLGGWQPVAVASRSPVPAWVSFVTVVAIVVVAVRAVREVRSLADEIRDAVRLRAVVRRRSSDVLVIHDAVPAAHAVGVGLTRRGAVVVTSSMLGLLDDDERAAVIAHERSHLLRRHAAFSAAVRLAAAVNPILTGMRSDVAYGLERWADEDAAAEAGRPVLASALAKAALAMLERARSARLAPGLALDRHGVSERVGALLAEPNRRSRPAWVLVVVSVAAALALAWATHDTERFFEAVRLWSHR